MIHDFWLASHGKWETIAYVIQGACRLEYGPDGRDVALAELGDYLYIGKGMIHCESNPTTGEQALVILRRCTNQDQFISLVRRIGAGKEIIEILSAEDSQSGAADHRIDARLNCL